MSLSPARPDLAFTNATRLERAVIVMELRELLGAKLVAFLGGVKLVSARDAPSVVQAWFHGLSNDLAIWRNLWDDGADLARQARSHSQNLLHTAARP